MRGKRSCAGCAGLTEEHTCEGWAEFQKLNKAKAAYRIEELEAEVNPLRAENKRLREAMEEGLDLLKDIQPFEQALIAENERLRSSLQAIHSLSGRTLIGDGRYDEGANAAFEQAAGIAASALQEDDDEGKN